MQAHNVRIENFKPNNASTITVLHFHSGLLDVWKQIPLVFNNDFTDSFVTFHLDDTQFCGSW